MATQPLFARVSDLLGVSISNHQRLSGGDFAEAFRVDLVDGSAVFAKTHRRPPPGFFTTEAAGLEWLRTAGALRVPEVIAVDDGDPADPQRPAFLVLEWIAETHGAARDEAAFGAGLAALHRSAGSVGITNFGRPDGRTTGSQAMPNGPCPTWVEFMADRRLLPLVDKCRGAGALPDSTLLAVEAVAGDLSRWGADDEGASLLHGDLWAGNRIVDVDGRSWIIDPAAHGGHREFDLAMMRLFGGFGPEAFDSYQAAHPLDDGWETRIALHQLPPLLVHAIKFGGGYVSAVERAVTALLAS